MEVVKPLGHAVLFSPTADSGHSLSSATSQWHTSCYGLNCILTNAYVEVLTPVPQNVIYLEIGRAFKNGD